MRSAEPARSLFVAMRSRSFTKRSAVRTVALDAWVAVSATPPFPNGAGRAERLLVTLLRARGDPADAFRPIALHNVMRYTLHDPKFRRS